MLLKLKYRLYHKDCFDLFPKIESNSIDMVLVDLPYGVTSCKWDSVIPLEPMWEQITRVSKQKAAIVMTAAQPFTTALISSNMKMFKYCWIWVKTKPTGYQICKVKPLSKYEDILVFYRKSPTYNPQMVKRNKVRSGIVHRTNNQMKVSGGGVYRVEKTYTHRYPTNVIEVANGSQKNKAHPTQKPVALMEYLIKTYTNKYDTILDFAMGSGTTGVACANLKRRFVGCDTHLGYFQIAEQRIKEAYENI